MIRRLVLQHVTADTLYACAGRTDTLYTRLGRADTVYSRDGRIDMLWSHLARTDSLIGRYGRFDTLYVRNSLFAHDGRIDTLFSLIVRIDSLIGQFGRFDTLYVRDGRIDTLNVSILRTDSLILTQPITISAPFDAVKTGTNIGRRLGYLHQEFFGSTTWLHGGNMIASEQTLGTNDNVALPIITNNQERTRITADGRIGIGTNALNRSALVEMASTSKGLLPPQMTSSEHDAITNPANGLLVYVNTPSEEGYWCFDGTRWLPFIITASSNSTIVTRYESSDESVINLSVLQDDDHIIVTLGANQVWEIEGMLEFSSTSAKPGVMFGLAPPSGANFKFRYHSNEGSATGFRVRVFRY